MWIERVSSSEMKILKNQPRFVTILNCFRSASIKILFRPFLCLWWKMYNMQLLAALRLLPSQKAGSLSLSLPKQGFRIISPWSDAMWRHRVTFTWAWVTLGSGDSVLSYICILLFLSECGILNCHFAFGLGGNGIADYISKCETNGLGLDLGELFWFSVALWFWWKSLKEL